MDVSPALPPSVRPLPLRYASEALAAKQTGSHVVDPATPLGPPPAMKLNSVEIARKSMKDHPSTAMNLLSSKNFFPTIQDEQIGHS